MRDLETGILLAINEETFKPLKSHRGKKLHRYTLEEKLKVVEKAKVVGNQAAAQEHGVKNEKTMREWQSKNRPSSCWATKQEISLRKRLACYP